MTEKLAKLDADLLRNNIAIENMQKQTFTAEQYYELLDAIVRYMEEIPENRIKQLMGLVLDKVELFPKRQANGRWVRNVRFKVPLDVDGTFYDSIGFRGDGEERSEEDDSVYFLPNETHVDTVVLLSHKKPDGHINVKVEFGEGEGKVPLDNIAKRAETYKPKERVTYKMIKEYIEAKYGFKVHTAYIAEVKRDLGLPMYDAPNAVEELKQPRKHPTAEKVEAIKDALKHFDLI